MGTQAASVIGGHSYARQAQTKELWIAGGESAAAQTYSTSVQVTMTDKSQVRGATQGLLRDFLLCPSEHDWPTILENCAKTCSAQDLNFSTLLQGHFVEGQLPIYWAILKRPTTPANLEGRTTPLANPDVPPMLAILDALLPLNAQGVAAARLACMIVSDNMLFVRLVQCYEVFSPPSDTDRVLLGGTEAVDTVSVEEVHGSGSSAAAPFVVCFSITQF